MANHLSYDVLSRLVERRAVPTEDARAQRHLAGCGRCRSELAWLERIRTLPARPDQTPHSMSDGWGHVRPRPAATEPLDFGRGKQPEASHVSTYWLKPASSSLLN